MKHKASELLFSPHASAEDFSKKARSAAEEFVRYCREHHLPPTYELFTKWIGSHPAGARRG